MKVRELIKQLKALENGSDLDVYVVIHYPVKSAPAMIPMNEPSATVVVSRYVGKYVAINIGRIEPTSRPG